MLIELVEKDQQPTYQTASVPSDSELPSQIGFGVSAAFPATIGLGEVVSISGVCLVCQSSAPFVVAASYLSNYEPATVGYYSFDCGMPSYPMALTTSRVLAGEDDAPLVLKESPLTLFMELANARSTVFEDIARRLRTRALECESMPARTRPDVSAREQGRPDTVFPASTQDDPLAAMAEAEEKNSSLMLEDIREQHASRSRVRDA